MSFRTEAAEPLVGEERLEHVLKQAPSLPPLTQALTISASLGLEPQEPPQPYVPFQPVYPSPKAVPDVVGSLFGDIDADDTGLFGKKKKDPLLQKSDSSKGGGLMSSLKAKGKSAPPPESPPAPLGGGGPGGPGRGGGGEGRGGTTESALRCRQMRRQ